MVQGSGLLEMYAKEKGDKGGAPARVDGVPQIVSQAFAAPVESTITYFPTQFPSPEGAPAQPIQGF